MEDSLPIGVTAFSAAGVRVRVNTRPKNSLNYRLAVGLSLGKIRRYVDDKVAYFR